MWVRKTQLELKREQDVRKKKYEIFVVFFVSLLSALIYYHFGPLENLVSIFKQDPELIFSLVFLPVTVYFGYRSYVIHGNPLIDRPGKICLGCGHGMGYSDDGWGFKSFGKKRKAWYQIKACNTPEKCDIAFQYEVKWVDDEKNENA